MADENWGTDLIVGLAVGVSVGYFDTWGPFDSLSFELDSNDSAREIRGLVLPHASDGELGVRLGPSF